MNTAEVEAHLRERAQEWDPITRENAECFSGDGSSGSAIEWAMVEGFTDVFNAVGGGEVTLGMGLEIKSAKKAFADLKLPPCNFAIWDQVKIGPYRVDFLAAVKDKNDRAWFIAIECDGHDFHERTKEQAEHDRKRDRQLQAWGYPILRFTGSEIWRSPTMSAWSCLMQIVHLMVSNEGWRPSA